MKIVTSSLSLFCIHYVNVDLLGQFVCVFNANVMQFLCNLSREMFQTTVTSLVSVVALVSAGWCRKGGKCVSQVPFGQQYPAAFLPVRNSCVDQA